MILPAAEVQSCATAGLPSSADLGATAGVRLGPACAARLRPQWGPYEFICP